MITRHKGFWISLLFILAGLSWAIVAHEHGLAHAFGIDTQASQEYDFVSGVGPMLMTGLGYAGMTTTMLRRLNCHVDGCWNMGLHPMAGGDFHVCRKHSHHPEKITVEHIHEQHRIHLERHAPGA